MRPTPVSQEHRAVAGFIAAAVPMVTFALAASQQWTHWSGLALAGAAGCAAGAASVVTIAQTASGPLSALAAAWGLAMAAWLLTVQAHGPWHWAAVYRLALASIVLALITMLAYARYESSSQAAELARRKRISEEQARRWEAVVTRANGRALPLKCVEERRKRSVTDVIYRITDPQVTVATVQALTPNIATALAEEFSGVAVEQGAHAAEVVLRLTRKRTFAAEFPFPELAELEKLGIVTINKALPVGWREDGEQVRVLLREVNAMLIGVTGAGKSNALNVLIALLSRCEDVLIFVIDPKGRLCIPWLAPWADGEAQWPVIDWLATDRREAWLMLEDLVRLREARSGTARQGSMMVPDPGHPQVVVLVDECSQLLSMEVATERQTHKRNSEYAAMVQELAKQLRSEAASLVLANQRPVVGDFGGAGTKANCALKWALACTRMSDALATVENDGRLAGVLMSLGHGGSLMWRGFDSDTPPWPFRWWRLDPALGKPHGQRDLDVIHSYAKAYQGKELEPEVRAALQHYRDRWNPDRCPALGQLIRNSPKAQQRVLEAAQEQAAAVAVKEREDTERQRQRKLDDLAQFDAMIKANYDQAEMNPRDLMFALLAEPPTGASWKSGATPAMLLLWLRERGKDVHRATLHRWLSAAAKDGAVELVPGSDPGTIHSFWRLVMPPPGG